MNRFSLLIIAVILFFSCKKESLPRNISSIHIKTFAMDSISIRAIHVFSKNKMFFAGSKGAVGFTLDGGNSWSTEYLRYQDTIVPNFRSIAFNGTDVFALSIGNPALLYKISEDKNTLVYTENHSKVFYDSMRFFDANNGIAMGDPTDNCLSILLTSDGGNSWQKIDCSQLPKTIDGEAAFAASNSNIAIVNNTVWLVTGGKKSRVFKSSNKVKTWQVFTTPIVQGSKSQGIYSVDFFDEKNGIIMGGDYANPKGNKQNKAITIDGGRTWTLVADNQNPNYKSCVKYVPNTNGKEVFAIGKTGVSFSNDGGITWKDISKESFFSIQFVDKNNAWLSGHQKIGKLQLN